jgi:TetR/AcrR family transcriptional regulator, transcriptional repressor for nem operon
MPRNAGEQAVTAKDVLVQAATDLMLRNGYTATTVDQICAAAGVTKGALFHHFPSKELLAETCLHEWPKRLGELHRSADYQALEDPVARLFGAIDLMSDLFQRPEVHKSCLAGTTVQEVSETNPMLRDAAQTCFVRGQAFFQSLLDDACRSRGVELDTASLANHWMCTMQGALLMWKASRDDRVIAESFQHLRNYFEQLLIPN